MKKENIKMTEVFKDLAIINKYFENYIDEVAMELLTPLELLQNALHQTSSLKYENYRIDKDEKYPSIHIYMKDEKYNSLDIALVYMKSNQGAYVSMTKWSSERDIRNLFKKLDE